MSTTTFDVFDSFDELRNSGIPEATAKILAKVLHQQAEEQSISMQKALDAQNVAMQKALDEQRAVLQKAIDDQRLAAQEALEKYDEAHSKEIATKGDLRETELRLQKEIEVVRKEIEVVRAEMRVGLEKCHTEIEKVRAELRVEIEKARNSMIMTVVVVGLGLAGLIIKAMH